MSTTGKLVLIASLATLAFSIVCAGDSITVDGKTYSDVYVMDGPSMYYVCLPSDGSIVNVEKAKVGLGDVLITEDRNAREVIKQWFDKKRNPVSVTKQENAQSANISAAPKVSEKTLNEEADNEQVREGSDSIRIGETLYEHVFIAEDAVLYNVYSPDGDKITDVSRKRCDVKDVRIDRDNPTRTNFFRRLPEIRRKLAAQDQESVERKPDVKASGHAEEERLRQLYYRQAMYNLQVPRPAPPVKTSSHYDSSDHEFYSSLREMNDASERMFRSDGPNFDAMRDFINASERASSALER